MTSRVRVLWERADGILLEQLLQDGQRLVHVASNVERSLVNRADHLLTVQNKCDTARAKPTAHPVGARNVAVGISHQRKTQCQAPGKCPVAVRVVPADAQHLSAKLAELGGVRTERLGLRRSARREVLEVEIENHRAARGPLGQHHIFLIAGGSGEIRRRLPHAHHAALVVVGPGNRQVRPLPFHA